MTEPLLFGTTLLAVTLTVRVVGSRRAGLAAGGGARAGRRMHDAVRGLADLRHALVLALAVLLRRGTPFAAAALAVARLAAYPASAIALFLLNSRWTVGAWFISSGFFVAENDALGHPLLAWDQVREGVYRLSGPALVWPAYAGAALVAWTFARSRARASLVLVLALAAAAALPWYAYLEGHPFRIRYGVPLVVACAALVGTGIGLLPRSASRRCCRCSGRGRALAGLAARSVCSGHRRVTARRAESHRTPRGHRVSGRAP